MSVHRRWFLSALVAVPLRLSAQAPVITPAGDPSVRNDTLYKLAVDSADHPDEPVVLLLDDGVVRYNADGTGTRTYRQITQILSQQAVEDFAEHSFSYAPKHQRLTVNWIRVVRPDGSVVSETPTQAQDADVPATLGDPVYTDTKVRRFSLSGVAPGTIVDWSYTVEERKPFRPGDFLMSWSVHTGRLVRRSRYIVDLPVSMTPHLVERNLTFKRQESVARGRRVFVWATQDVPRLEPEQFMADSNGVAMSIYVAAPGSWAGIARWYAGLATSRTTLDAATRAKLPPLLAQARTADDSLRALQRWIAQDIRYVSIALGLGGYQPRRPAEVVTTGYGDCKDKATLFVAAATALGFQAYPVLLGSSGKTERALPSLNQFDHAIAVVERPGGRVYVDLTADLAPYGEIPSNLQGQFALIVHPDGTSEEVTLPEAPPSANRLETRFTGTLAADGYIAGTYSERYLGARQYGLRRAFQEPLDSTRRANFAHTIATRLFAGAEADSVQLFDGRDLTADPRVSLRIGHALAARPAGTGNTIILTLPFGSMRGMGDMATGLATRGTRLFPIDAARVVGAVTLDLDFTLTLPAGWRAQLPRDVEVTGKWGTYTARYKQDGTQLHLSRRLEGARGVYPPDALPDLLGWLRAVGADDVPYLVLERAATP